MTIATSSPLGLPSARTLEWLAGSDLLASPGGTSSDQLAGLGPVASLVETSIVGDDPAAEGTALPAAVTGPANQAVLDTHAQIEEAGHQATVLNGPLHGLTSLGETIGLGHLGTPGNLATDAAAAAQGSQIEAVPGDAANVAAAVGNLAGTVAAAASSDGGVVGDGNLPTSVAAPLNQGVLSLHSTLEEVGHQNPALNGPIHGLTGLGEAIGLGHIGAPANVVTDVADLPGALLSGGGAAAINPVLHDLANVTTALDTLVNQVAAAPATGGGPLSPTGPLAPVSAVANAAVLDLHAGIEGVGHDVPALNDAVHAVTGLGETVGLGHLGEPGSLVTDAANLPGAILSGGGTGVLAPVLADAGTILNSAGALAGAVTDLAGSGTAGGSPVQAVTDILGSGGHAADLPTQVVGGATELLGSGTAGAVPLAGGLVDALAPSGGEGTHPLVEVGAGPSTPAPILDANLLSAPAEAGHAVQVNAVDVGSAVPTLASVSLLSGDGIVFPASGAGGADSLVGHALDLAPASAPAHAEAAPVVHVDLGAAALDLGGHVDGHALDAQPDALPSGLHLLGL